MTTPFPSRRGTLREKKSSLQQNEEDFQTQPNDLKLTLLEDEKDSYQPSVTNSNTRPNFRLLKGRIDKSSTGQNSETTSVSNTTNSIGQGSDKYIGSANSLGVSNKKLTLNDDQSGKQDLKLVIHDTPAKSDNKIKEQDSASKPPEKKRLIMMKKTEPTNAQEQKQPEVRSKVQEQETKIEKIEQKPIANNQSDEKPIKEEEAQQSNEVGENELIQCPEGCGRKFNKKALEKHVKACKLVFMSKRKEFNSEAKRITSKQQADIVKQKKIQQKRDLSKTRGKEAFGKTGDNWKLASEDFRNAVKNLKKEERDEEEPQDIDIDVDFSKEQQIKKIECEYCEKQFADNFYEMHLENCVAKKQKEEKKRPGAVGKRK